MSYTGKEKNSKRALIIAVILAAIVLSVALILIFTTDIGDKFTSFISNINIGGSKSEGKYSKKIVYDDIADRVEQSYNEAPFDWSVIIRDVPVELYDGFLRNAENTIKYEPIVEDVSDKDFFKTALFLGDAITQGLEIYKTAGEAKVISSKGMNAANALRHLDEIEEAAPERIYILLGFNDTTDNLPISSLMARYDILIINIKEAAPDAKVYVQAVFPVSEAVDKKNNGISLDRIKQYNEKLGELCVERNVNFIDTYSIFADADGYIEEYITYDGIYMRPEYYPFWINMLRENSGLRVPK